MANNDSVIELERSILGMILINKDSINSVRGFLASADFFEPNNRILYKAILDANDGGFEIEMMSVVSQLTKDETLEKIGGEDFLIQLTKEAALPSNSNKFMKEIIEKARLREVKKVLGQLAKDASKEGTTADKILEGVEQSIISITRDTEAKDFQSVSSIADESLLAIQKRATNQGVSGIVTNFPSFDKITSGLQRGDLFILAARPSMGKTAFALNIAQNVAEDHKVAVFSLEMPACQLVDRIYASKAFVSQNKIRDSYQLSANEWTKLDLAKERIKKLNLFIDDTPGLRLADLVWKARRLKKNEGLDVIVIDYLQLLTIRSSYSEGNRQQEVSVISRTLKQLARELDVPVIALSQLSRRVESREDKRPMMSDIRESGAIEQDADVISFLYRPSYYDKESTDKSTELIISKHRNGELGTLKFKFEADITLFVDADKGGK